MGHLPLALALAGCTAPDDRDLSAAPEATDTAPVTRWQPGDSAGDTGAPWVDQLGDACGSTLSEPLEGGDVLAPSWCVRLSPEPFEDGSEDTGTPAPPPCGFENLLGAFDLVGSAADPVALFCDADPDAGLFLTRYDTQDATIRSRNLAERTCWADPSTASLSPQGEGLLAFWTDLNGNVGGDDASGLVRALLDPDGALLEAPTAPPLEVEPWGLQVVGEADRLLLVRAIDRALSAIPLDADGQFSGAPAAIIDDAQSFGAAQTSAGAVVATCDGGTGTLNLFGLGADGAVQWSKVVVGADCSYETRPALAARGDVLAVAWDELTEGYLAFFDLGGAELDRRSLGEGARFPQVLASEQGWWVADTSGALLDLDVDGELRGAWRHPDLALSIGSPTALRLLASDDHLAFLFVGSDIRPVFGGHVNTFNYAELSVVPAPEQR
ncbi:MAG: hypothetical protein H6739_26875 [Alphaproteobacteria bacterium]|nr:hypothetical protein [Alphaproteobacteria bacterium]